MILAGHSARIDLVTGSKTSRTAGTRKERGEEYFTLWQRIVLIVVPAILWALVWLLGNTWRFEVIAEEGADPVRYGQKPRPGVYCFWHQCVLPGSFYFSRSQAVLLISRSFDGELVTRYARHFNYEAVRGSSSKSGREGFLGLRNVIEAGGSAIFTADGPRGPAFKTKPGPIKLAQLTSAPICVFHVEPERAWALNSWDRFMIPKPFTRICVSWANGLSVPAELSESEFEDRREELNAAINRARHNARAYFGKGAE